MLSTITRNTILNNIISTSIYTVNSSLSQHLCDFLHAQSIHICVHLAPSSITIFTAKAPKFGN